jgi:iron complex transport system ATP-binding protein
VHQVPDLRCEIIPDPQTGTPFIVPEARRRVTASA